MMSGKAVSSRQIGERNAPQYQSRGGRPMIRTPKLTPIFVRVCAAQPCLPNRRMAAHSPTKRTVRSVCTVNGAYPTRLPRQETGGARRNSGIPKHGGLTFRTRVSTSSDNLDASNQPEMDISAVDPLCSESTRCGRSGFAGRVSAPESLLPSQISNIRRQSARNRSQRFSC